MSRRRESHIFGIDHDYSAVGSFEAEVQLRKGQEIKQDLADVLGGLTAGQLVDKRVEVEITISNNLGLFIIPRFPVDRFRIDNEAERQETAEPFVIKNVKVELEVEDDEPSLLMAGELDEPGAEPWRYRLDPLAGHEIIAIAKDGDYKAGGLRVASDDTQTKLKLEIY